MDCNNRVLLGLSGGVDSCAAALILQEQGYEVCAVYLKMHNNETVHKDAIAKAEMVANYIGVPFEVVDVKEHFKAEVYDYFIESYIKGETPNPCVVCNKKIKLEYMLNIANTKGCNYIASGHYVQVVDSHIAVAIDDMKDQSYFLGQIKPEDTKRLIFPLGGLRKEEVKEIASRVELFDLIVSQPESSEICFVPNDYTQVLSNHIDVDCDGEVVDINGEVVGSHKGYMHYTVGKRRGFSVKGAHEPHYVLKTVPKENRIIVGKREQLNIDSFVFRPIWLEEGGDMAVKVRYRTKAVKCSIEHLDDQNAKVLLDEPLFGVAKGQFAVFYRDGKVVGCGVIG